MIHRTASSRRRRASRSAAASPNRSRRPSTVPPPAGELLSGGPRPRRASIAVPEDASPTEFVTVTAADDDSEIEIETYDRSPRGSLVPGSDRSPRRSLTPEIFNRSPRGSLVPDYNRSPRNSIIPDTRSNNLLPEPQNYSRSPRGSLCPEADQFSRSRQSLIPDDFNRSPRNSLVPEYNRSARNSLVPDTSPSRSHRNSLVPDGSPNRSPRGSICAEGGRSPRGSICPEMTNRTPRGSICPEQSGNRSPRGSICPESGNRSPRGSICPETSGGSRSPRGSLVPEPNKSPRGSIASDTTFNRSPRNSLPLQESPHMRSPRGSLGSNSLTEANGRSPRGSVDITLPDSVLLPTTFGPLSGRPTQRSPSPYRNRQSGANYHGPPPENTGSRRASSSVSQLCPLEGVRALLIGPAYVSSQVALARKDSLAPVSGDERRHLCEHTKLNSESGGIAAYGSVVYQLNHANLEATGTCDFLARALGIVYRTVVVTVVLGCLTTLPVIMFIMGIQFVRDCPKEPRIPIYMIVGGSFGTIKMFWLIWRQVRSRRFERRQQRAASTALSAPSRVADFLLTGFLVVWFVCGNFWILGIYWPEFEPKLFDPNNWCHKTLYVFSLVHLGVLYGVIGLVVLLSILFLACQLSSGLFVSWYETESALLVVINTSIVRRGLLYYPLIKSLLTIQHPKSWFQFYFHVTNKLLDTQAVIVMGSLFVFPTSWPLLHDWLIRWEYEERTHDDYCLGEERANSTVKLFQSKSHQLLLQEKYREMAARMAEFGGQLRDCSPVTVLRTLKRITFRHPSSGQLFREDPSLPDMSFGKDIIQSLCISQKIMAWRFISTALVLVPTFRIALMKLQDQLNDKYNSVGKYAAEVVHHIEGDKLTSSWY